MNQTSGNQSNWRDEDEDMGGETGMNETGRNNTDSGSDSSIRGEKGGRSRADQSTDRDTTASQDHGAGMATDEGMDQLGVDTGGW